MTLHDFPWKRPFLFALFGAVAGSAIVYTLVDHMVYDWQSGAVCGLVTFSLMFPTTWAMARSDRRKQLVYIMARLRGEDPNDYVYLMVGDHITFTKKKTWP